MENRETFFARLTPFMPPSELRHVEVAYMMAKYGHRAQVRNDLDDKGDPIRYFEHLRGVALILIDEAEVRSWELIVAALLHDTLEDTDLWAEDLRRLGFEPHIVAAVEAMTHHEDEPYEEYILRLKQNALARVVKRADIAHNTSPERLAHLPQADVDRLTKKYKRALELLAQD
jgi:(p)ppGpp synthase/HD superfamily hydrolase